jgi:hypothetical protein
LRFPQRANDSVSGALESALSRFIRWNTGRLVELEPDPHGDAEQREREQERDAPAPRLERSFPRARRQPRITSSDRKSPIVAVVWIHEV